MQLDFIFTIFFFTWILFLGGFPLLGRVDEEVVFPFDVGIEFFFFCHLKENSKPSFWKSKCVTFGFMILTILPA
jgi:hypothetical protein